MSGHSPPSAGSRGQIVVLKAGIVHEGSILVLTSAIPDHGGSRDLPGGKLLYGEDPLSALQREVFEETQLSIDPVAPVRIWSFVEVDGTQYVGITVACTADSKAVRLSSEHMSHQWLLKASIPDSWPERDELLAVFERIEAGAPKISGTSRPQWSDI
jgi:8-oxo-dGTP pyrophosphatase MutT (NUDIX family)